MNKKGFTTVELILTLAIVMVVMTTILSVTYTYRDEGSYERTITEVKDYKNNLTKIIYDDIYDIRPEGEEKHGRVVKIEKVDINDNSKYKLVTNSGSSYILEIIDRNTTKNGKSIREVGINYDGTEYIIPGSNNSLVSFNGEVTLKPDVGSESSFYLLDIYFQHKKLDEKIKIHLIVSK